MRLTGIAAIHRSLQPGKRKRCRKGTFLALRTRFVKQSVGAVLSRGRYCRALLLRYNNARFHVVLNLS